MSRRTTVLVVLGALVSIAGNVVAWGLLSAARDDSGWSVTGPSTVPSEEPTRPPSEGPSGGPGGDPDDVIHYVALGDSFTAAPDPCSEASGAFRAQQLTSSIEQIGDRLRTAVAEIEARSPDAQVLLVGYPVLTPASGTCPDRLPLADGDFGYVNRMSRKLHTEIQRAATRAGATYVEVHTASQGHDICPDDPWVNDRSTDPGRALLYHPFVEEQAAVARLILAALDRPTPGDAAGT